MDFEGLSEFLNSVSLPTLAVVGMMAIIFSSIRIVPVVVKFFTDMGERQQKDDERQQKVWQHLMDTSIQLAKTQQGEFERQLGNQQTEFERQLGIQKTDFERELQQEREAREKLAAEMGASLLKKEQEIEGLNRKISTLNRDLQDALKSLGTAQQLIKDLTDYKDQLESRLAAVSKERDELADIVDELSTRLDQVEKVQKTGTDKLRAAQPDAEEKREAEKKDKAA
jgi:chromosome segregation ATPase